jgi:hypothetical protein
MVVAKFKVISRHCDPGKLRNTSGSMLGSPNDIRTGNLQSMSSKLYRLSQIARLEPFGIHSSAGESLA